MCFHSNQHFRGWRYFHGKISRSQAHLITFSQKTKDTFSQVHTLVQYSMTPLHKSGQTLQMLEVIEGHCWH